MAYGERWVSRSDRTEHTGEQLKEKWLPLCSLVNAIPHLKSFTCQGVIYPGTDQLPTCLIEAIKEYHPRAHLHVQNWTRVRDDEDHNNEAELALATSPNLRSIQATLWTAVSGFDFKPAALKRIISLAPNLESVDISEASSGCLIQRFTLELLMEQERLSKLFEIAEMSNSSLKSVKCRASSFFYVLKDVIDLSKLEILDIDYIPGATFFKDDGPVGKFSSLKHLSTALGPSIQFDLGELGTTLGSFLMYCNPLESLSLTNRCGRISLPTVLANNGPALRSLSLHETETSILGEPRETLHLTQIEEIRRMCPLLEDLTLDLDRASSPDSKKAILSKLAKFPRLSVIRIYFDLGIAEEAARTPWVFLDEDEAEAEVAAHQANPFHPFKDTCWLENIWSFLRNDKKEHGTVPLRELHIKVGEWEREIGAGYPAGWIIWESSNRRYYIATASERDDLPNEISVQVMSSGMQHSTEHDVRHLPSHVGF